MIDLNELAKEVHANSVEKGFWEGDPSDQHFLMLVITELSEAIEADRKRKNADIVSYKKYMSIYTPEDSPYAFEHLFETYVKDSKADEIVDAFIRLLDLSGARNIDLSNRQEYQKYSRENYKDLQPQTFTEFCFDLCKLITEGCVSEPMYIIMVYCECNNIDLFWHIELKMKYNKAREYKHGKKY